MTDRLRTVPPEPPAGRHPQGGTLMKRRNHLVAGAAVATVLVAAWASPATPNEAAPTAGRPDVAVHQAHPGVGPFADLHAWRKREATAAYWREVGHNMQLI